MSEKIEICACEQGKYYVVFGKCVNCAKRVERRAQPPLPEPPEGE